MARLDSYPLDPIAEGDDKILATDKDGVVTKNLTVTSVVNYVNSVRGGGYPISAKDGTELLLAVWPDGRLEAIPKDSTAPDITSSPVITGTLNVGETLTVAPGAFTGLPEPTTVLQWQRSDDGLTGWADIAGATGTTYLLGSLDEDKYIRVQQTEENILGTATANSASTGQIGPAVSTLLLDLYPNSAAAYSSRKLRTLYSGSAIKVRRASDNALQDIGFVGNQLDTASLESFCSGTDGFVQTWYDQSGNGNDATQSNSAYQPKIVSSGSTILENGKPSIDFDGVDDHLLSSSTFNITSTTTLSVINMDVSSEAYPIMVQSSNNTGFRQHLNINYIRGRFSGTNIDDNSISSNNVHALFTIINDGSTGSLFWNSQTQASGSAPLSADPTAVISIAGNSAVRSAFSDGKIQELILYSTDESSNRTGIETNINDFYSIY